LTLERLSGLDTHPTITLMPRFGGAFLVDRRLSQAAPNGHLIQVRCTKWGGRRCLATFACRAACAKGGMLGAVDRAAVSTQR
jgi:hypothetical protein